MTKEHDNVNHPKHYEREGAMECIDEMILLFGVEEVKSFCKLNAWKYRYRAADKNGEEDIKKSDWYLRKYRELNKSSLTTYGNITIPYNSPYYNIVPCSKETTTSDAPNMPWTYADTITTASPNPNFKTVTTC